MIKAHTIQTFNNLLTKIKNIYSCLVCFKIFILFLNDKRNGFQCFMGCFLLRRNDKRCIKIAKVKNLIKSYILKPKSGTVEGNNATVGGNSGTVMGNSVIVSFINSKKNVEFSNHKKTRRLCYDQGRKIQT